MKVSYISLAPEGVLISIRVQPKSSKVGPLGVLGSSLKWGVNAPPVDGKANEALIKDIAKRVGCAKSKLSILKGEQSRDKIILIQGVGLAEIEKFIAAQVS